MRSAVVTRQQVAAQRAVGQHVVLPQLDLPFPADEVAQGDAAAGVAEQELGEYWVSARLSVPRYQECGLEGATFTGPPKR